MITLAANDITGLPHRDLYITMEVLLPAENDLILMSTRNISLSVMAPSFLVGASGVSFYTWDTLNTM